MGHGGALVESMTFNRSLGRGFDSCSSRHVGTLGKLPVRFGVNLRYNIRAAVGNASE